MTDRKLVFLRRLGSSIALWSIALGIIFQNTANAIYGAEPRRGPPLVSEGFFEVAGIQEFPAC